MCCRATNRHVESVGVDWSGGVVRPTAAIVSEWTRSRPRSTSARRCSTPLGSAVVAPSAPPQITVVCARPASRNLSSSNNPLIQVASSDDGGNTICYRLGGQGTTVQEAEVLQAPPTR
jgi:hypothetical protein